MELTRRLATVGIRSRETHITRTQTMARKACHGLPAFVFVPHPVGLGRGAQAKADQGRHLFEPKASLCLTPLLPSTAGCLERSGRTQTIGSPFFSLGFFGDAKKSKSPAGARPGLSANHRVSATRVVSDRNGLRALSLASHLHHPASRECRP